MRSAMAAAERLGVRRMLQHERALQVAGAVQAGGQTEMAVEQRAGASEQVEKLVAGHARRGVAVVYRSGSA